MSRTPSETLDAAIAKLDLTYTAEFVPQSVSRFANDKHRSLNWSIRISRGERDAIVTSYMQGIGYVPGRKPEARPTVWQDEQDRRAAETGRYGNGLAQRLPKPELRDVLYSLVSDAEAADSTFEDWAGNYGYNTDSRTDEKIYRECVDIGIRLRNLIGAAAIEQLRELFRDY